MPSPVSSVHQQTASHQHGIGTETPKEKKPTVLETHGYYLGKTIGSGSYATVRVSGAFLPEVAQQLGILRLNLFSSTTRWRTVRGMMVTWL